MVKKLIRHWSLIDYGKKLFFAVITALTIGVGSMLIMSMVNAQHQSDRIDVLEKCSTDLVSRVSELEKCKSNQVTKEDLKEFKADIRLLIRMQGEINNTGKSIENNTNEIKKNL